MSCPGSVARPLAAVLLLPLLLLLAVQSLPAHAAAAAADTGLHSGPRRGLQRATIVPLISGGSITANLPVAPLSSVTAPFTLPLSFGGVPGTPSPPSPKRYYKMSCDNLRPTFVVVPGISGSQLDATQAGNAGGCSSFSSARQVYADLSWLQSLQCFAHMMSVGYDSSTGRYTNSSGTQMSAWEGGWPDGTDTQIISTYYAGLWQHLEAQYGYRKGVDMFAAPYDWRMDFDGLNQIGQFEQMTARISAAVQQNCGQKAILLAHSMGANVILRLLREPRFQAWRQQNVRGLILVGPTLSGSGASAWQTKLSGVLDPYPAWTNMIPGFKLASLPTFPLEAAIHEMTLGMPSFALVLPGTQPLGSDHVLVETPSRSYTVGQQKELLRDMGDKQAASLFDKVQAQNLALLDAGPIPGIESFCVYGTAVPTSTTLQYKEPVRSRQVLRRPANIIKGPGDGTVNLPTLRLCSKLMPSSHVVEVNDPAIDHSAVTREPAGLAALDTIFAKLGMRKGVPAASAQQVSSPVSNRAAAAQSRVAEESGRKG